MVSLGFHPQTQEVRNHPEQHNKQHNKNVLLSRRVILQGFNHRLKKLEIILNIRINSTTAKYCSVACI